MKFNLCIALTLWIIGITGVTVLQVEPVNAVPIIKEKLPGERPLLKVDKAVRVVEATVSEQEIEQVFTLSNAGGKLLQLEVERTSCGCVGATLSAKTLKPSQRATLTFKMQASGWGSKTESVTVKTNDPEQPHITLTVQAKMPPTIVPNPPQLAIETIEGEAAQRYISLLLPKGASLLSVRAEQAFITAKVIESQPIAGGSFQRIAVSIAASAPSGSFKDDLIFRLKNAPVLQIGVPIEGMVKDDVQVQPNSVFLGQLIVGSTKRTSFLVQSHSGKAFQIKAVQSSDPRVTLQASPIIMSPSQTVEVSVQGDDKVGSILRATVRLTLSSGRSLAIQVIGEIAPASGAAPQSEKLKIGARAPDFAAMDSNGNLHKLTDFSGKKYLLLTFFPKCFTGGCAGQLSSLRDNQASFDAADTQILAVSVDPADGDMGQKAFAAHLGLQFPVIPDTQRTLCLLYGAVQDKTEIAARRSILIDKAGIVRWIDTNINVQTHGADMLAKLRELGMAR